MKSFSVSLLTVVILLGCISRTRTTSNIVHFEAETHLETAERLLEWTSEAMDFLNFYCESENFLNEKVNAFYNFCILQWTVTTSIY